MLLGLNDGNSHFSEGKGHRDLGKQDLFDADAVLCPISALDCAERVGNKNTVSLNVDGRPPLILSLSLAEMTSKGPESRASEGSCVSLQ